MEESSRVENSVSSGENEENPNGWEQYETYVAQLGWLMSSNGWETAEDLSPTDYVMWYGYRVYDLPSSAEYQIEGRDGLFSGGRTGIPGGQLF